MKKSVLILAVLVIAAAIIFLLLPDDDSTISQKYKNFAIENPQEVDSIFMANKERFVLLRKQPDGTWTVNNKYEVKDNMIRLLLVKMSRLEAKAPVPISMRDHIIGRLITTGIKVQVYAKGNKIKEYFVGDNTPNEKGTYMFIQGKNSEPFEVHEPGFVGYLNVYYNLNEKDWKTNKLMAYEPDEIKSVEITYYPEELQMESFKLERAPEGMKLTNLANPNIQGVNVNKNALNAYFTLFKILYHAGTPPNMSQEIADSIFNTTPWAVLKVTGVDGKTNKLAFHNKPVTKETKVQHDENGVPMTRDTDLSYCFLNDNHDLVGIDHYSYSKYLKGYSDFFKSVEQLSAEQQASSPIQ